MSANNNIQQLRQLMKQHEIAAYIIPSADFHESEMVGDYFQARAFITGFTGSNGTLVVTQDEACLWTDGRYFVQAELELADSEIHLMRMGEEGTPKITEYLTEKLGSGDNIGFDGRTIPMQQGLTFQKIAHDKGARVITDFDLVDVIWQDRPAMPKANVWIFDETYAGESAESKLSRVRAEMLTLDAEMHLITTLDDITWLLNIRGGDIQYNPFVLAYLCIWMDRAELYIDERKLSDEVCEYLSSFGVQLKPYDQVYQDLQDMECASILLDAERVNFRIYHMIPHTEHIIKATNPAILMKSKKNQVEMENTRLAHIKDGVALTKFIYWLKSHSDRTSVTERSAAIYLEQLRAEQEGFIEQSFAPIMAFAEHGAIVHYSSTEATDVPLLGNSFFLVDTGGQYLEGTTDVTRTIVLGEVSEEMKSHFTLVATSMLNLSDVKFLKGCTGNNIDYVARAKFWKRGLDYKHGTGHGVGQLGSVHEPPSRIAWQSSVVSPAFEEGMIVSNEPGLYLAGSYGIRIENLIMARNSVETAYGQFMEFETLTLAPIDLDAILVEEMTGEEKHLLNQYHARVYHTLSSYLTEDEQAWLQEYTREI